MAGESQAESTGFTIITVSYNSREALQQFWSPPPRGVDWTVIDNASSDGSPDVAARLGATVIRLARNIGFGKANNIGLREVTSPYVLFANPDVRVDYSDLPKLAAELGRRPCLLAPQLTNVDGTAQVNGRGLPFVQQKVAHRSARLQKYAPLSEYARNTAGHGAPVEVAWVMGAALAARTDDFRRIGGWDERFFIYYEDHEIGFRAWENGLAVVVDPRVRWVHGWARETTKRSVRPWVHEIASASRFYRKRPDLLSQALNRRMRGPRVCIPGVGRFISRAKSER